MRRAIGVATVLVAALFAALPAGAPPARGEPAPAVPYIVGGALSSPTAWPAMVALVAEGPMGLGQFCGGTLIRADLVMTAAHCTEEFVANPSQLQVLLGRTDLTAPGGELIPASAIYQHPWWNSSTYEGDIAVIRLSSPSLRPPSPFMNLATEADWSTNPTATISGWGATDPDGETSSSQLREVTVPVLADRHCLDTVSTYHSGLDICAGGVAYGVCFGDSGGPLYAHDRNGIVSLGGVVSRGLEVCGLGPGIMTRVAVYADWVYLSTTSGATSRSAGPDRYATAAALSSRFATGAPVAYLVTGDRFPDAVTAAAVAGRLGGPVLLATRDSLPEPTRAELARLRPARLVVVGGAGAISDGVLAAASGAAGVPAVRVAGADRYATAAGLSADAYPAGSATVFVTVGTAFPDAVASGAVAGGPAGGPVLLTGTDVLPPATAAEIQRLAPSNIVILGGTSAVSPAVEAALAGLGSVTIERVRGEDRYVTAAALSARSFSPGVPVVYIATGRAFPDALASGPVAVTDGAPVLLVDGDRVPPAVLAEIQRLAPGRIEVLGGAAAVPYSTAWLLDGQL